MAQVRAEVEETITRTSEQVTKVLCDLCGKEAKYPKGADRHWGPWCTGYDVDTVKVEAKYGSNFPEGPVIDVESFDVCPDCWKSKIRPFFAGFGASPREQQVD